LGFFASKKTFFRIFRCATGFGIVVTSKIGNPPSIEKVVVTKTARKWGKTAKNGKKCPFLKKNCTKFFFEKKLASAQEVASAGSAGVRTSPG
jgi:hypothetical protein